MTLVAGRSLKSDSIGVKPDVVIGNGQSCFRQDEASGFVAA